MTREPAWRGCRAAWPASTSSSGAVPQRRVVCRPGSARNRQDHAGQPDLLHHVADAGQAVYVTLLAEYHARMMQHLGVMTFFDGSKVPDQLTFVNRLASLHETGLKGLSSLLRHEVTLREASVLVIDGIVSARRAAPDDQAFNEFVHELQAVAVATACTVLILTSAPTNVIEAEHTVVDGIVELSGRPTGWSAASSLQVVKFRGSGFLRGRHAYRIDQRRLVVHPRVEALLARPLRPDAGAGGKVTSGIGQLDTMLGGGFMLGSSVRRQARRPTGVRPAGRGRRAWRRCSSSTMSSAWPTWSTPS